MHWAITGKTAAETIYLHADAAKPYMGLSTWKAGPEGKVLKNAGVGYGDYIEQITYLLFLKLADEMTELGYDNPIHTTKRRDDASTIIS